MFGNLELDFAYPRMITDATVNSYDNISRTSVSVPICEDDPYGFPSSSDSSSDESSDDEFIGRPLLSCPPMNENGLTYRENDEMY